MSTRKAPCGHDGEVVIGAYVRCTLGCSQDPKSPETKRKEYNAKAARRGEPGHVDYCACGPCTLRRRARKVIFKTRNGTVAEVPWDGMSKEVSWKAPAAAPSKTACRTPCRTARPHDHLRHWQIVDDDGDVLADGMLDVEFESSDHLILNLDTLTSA